ncbi:cytochrome c oxidase, cbb3-type, CcoQ subunit [Campylobacter concisus]|mgnify:FL=1|uniref:cytochrome c oxidase, cbb3-type, CcoQ subunit n=1 Tax=Campylobacter concisus TaxID=199 RepID=UPI000CD97231|nr:cytochrome c oxidase, cbb3-type, CcoQ subunit [Campylobacter concisus]
MENIREFQAYGYFFLTAFLVITLYAYFFHLYKSEKTGRRNYEKYSKLALNDEIGGEILERKATKESVCNG